jgi:anti-sigma factor RsiW
MSDGTCGQMEDLLVDYADDALPPKERAVVETHVAGCERCRTLLAALRKSQDLVIADWARRYSEVADLQPSDALPRRRHLPAYAATIAAAAAVAVLGVLTWRAMVARPAQAPGRTAAPGQTDSPGQSIAAVPQLTPEQVRRSVEQAGATTALLASVDWLAEQPANRQIARQQYEFITRMYAGTEAAAQARSRLAALEQRRS